MSRAPVIAAGALMLFNASFGYWDDGSLPLMPLSCGLNVVILVSPKRSVGRMPPLTEAGPIHCALLILHQQLPRAVALVSRARRCYK